MELGLATAKVFAREGAAVAIADLDDLWGASPWTDFCPRTCSLALLSVGGFGFPATLRRGQEQAGVAAGRHPLLERLNCESKYGGSSIARVRMHGEPRSWPSIEYERVSGSSGSRFGLEQTFCFGTHVHTSCFGSRDLPCSRQWG